jgi:two-component SAPR family response regulator/c-di-GMP-binding flagellar brake protein YcgR
MKDGELGMNEEFQFWVNQLLYIDCDGETFVTKIVEIGMHQLFIQHPTNRKKKMSAELGRQVSISFFNDRGQIFVYRSYLGLEDHRLSVAKPQEGSIRIVQRRSYVRVPAQLKISLDFFNGETREYVTHDISGGGIAFQCSDAHTFVMGELITGRVYVNNQPLPKMIPFKAKIVGIRKDPPLCDHQLVAIAFVGMRESYRREIIRFCMQRQSDLRKGLAPSSRRLERTLNQVIPRNALAVPASKERDQDMVYITCFGGIDIRNRQRDQIKWISKKSTEVFAYLLLQRGNRVPRANLLEDVFGGMPLKNAELYLNTAIYQLRKALEPYGLNANVITGCEGYSFDIKDVYVDFIDFEEKLKRLDLTDGINIKQAIEIEKQFTGDLFGDRAFPWAWSEIERLSQMYSSFVKQLASILIERKDLVTSIRLLKKLLSRDELDDEANSLLMRAYALQNNKKGLIQQYERYVEGLWRELGIGPSREVTKLYSQLHSELG